MPDLSNDSLWHLIADEQLNKSGEQSILPFSFPLLFSTRYLKLFVDTTDKSLRYGGSISLMIGSINTATPIFATKRNLIFNQWRLVDFPLVEATVSSQFFVKYLSPYWFTNVHLLVYQYYEQL